VLSYRLSVVRLRALPWARGVAICAAVTVGALGAFTLVGWYGGSAALLQVARNIRPPHHNLAVALLLLAVGLVALTTQRRTALAVSGAGCLLLGGATLYQDATGVELAFNELMVRDLLGTDAPYPRRMAPIAALLIVLQGGLYLGVAAARNARRRWGLLGVSGGVVMALSLVSLIAQAVSAETAFGWNRWPNMAPQAASALLLLGAATFAYGLDGSLREAGRTPGWLALAAGLTLLTLCMALALALEANRSLELRRDNAATSRGARSALQMNMENTLGVIERMAGEWSILGAASQGKILPATGIRVRAYPMYRALLWEDANGRVRSVAPPHAQGKELGRRAANDARLTASFDAARITGRAQLSRGTLAPPGGAAMRAVAPLQRAGRFDGFLIGILDVENLFGSLLSAEDRLHYDWAVFEGSERLYATPGFNLTEAGTEAVDLAMNVESASWRLTLHPTRKARADSESAIPSLVFGGGLALAVLLTLTVHFMLAARRRSATLLLANRELHRQMDVREQAEAELRHGNTTLTALNARLEQEIAERARAEERFRSIVESAPNAMLITDRTGRIVDVNSQTSHWFGYDRAKLIGQRVEVLIPHRFRDKHVGQMDGYLAAPTAMAMSTGPERCGMRSDGSEFPVDVSLSPVETPDGVRVICAIIDITDRKRVEAELKQSNASLGAVNRELEAFAYAVSHDLRQPLRGMAGFGQVLLEDYGERLDETGKSYLHRIQAACGRMGQLIDDLLDLSRITRRELRRDEVRISELADEAIRALREREPGRAVEVTIAPGLVVRADSRMVRIVLENLLGNAWKFTSRVPLPRIEVGESGTGAERAFHVRDNGAGFDMAYADKLFVPFQRLHAAREFPGTGIGLATVQRIVSRHGGRVWAEAEPGKGATIHFTFEPPMEGG
jgi:PAS domain S-box-containing protein